MASPPLNVEDTDADFFDNLVEGDDDVVSQSNHKFTASTDDVDSSDANGFSIEDEEEEAEKHSVDAIAPLVSSPDVHPDVPEKDILVSEERVSPVPPVDTAPAVLSEPVVASKNSGSKTTGIKVVQWNLFHADGSAQQGGYSDLFAGDSGEDPFAGVDDNGADPFANIGFDSGHGEKVVANADLSSYGQIQNDSTIVASTVQATNGQELYDSQSWENMYPGWKYDLSTGQWIAVEGYDATANTQGSVEDKTHATGDDVVSGQKWDVSYLQQTVQSVSGTVSQDFTTGSVSNWNQAQQATPEYPAHMYFDPQYPGWYYDTITQEWCSLESYTSAVQSSATSYSQGLQSGTSYNSAVQSSTTSYSQGLQSGTTNAQGLQSDTTYGRGLQSDRTYGQGLQTGTTHGQGLQTGTTHGQGLQGNTTYNQGVQSSTTYNQGAQSGTSHNQGLQRGNNSSNRFFPENEQSYYAGGQVGGYGSQNLGGQGQAGVWTGSEGNYTQHGVKMWQPETVGNNVHTWQQETVGKSIQENDAVAGYPTDNQQQEKPYGSRYSANNLQDGQMGYPPTGNASSYEDINRSIGGNGVVNRFQNFVPTHPSQELNRFEHDQQQTFPSNTFHGSQNAGDNSHQIFQNRAQLPYIHREERSSAGRPPHALVTFGFGGKLVVMKDSSSFGSNSAYGTKDSVGSSISVLDVMDVVADRSDTTIVGLGVSDYFGALCQQSFPGPLVGGNVGNKELNKWIEDRISNCESPNMDYKKRELLRLLLSLLKIASQHYGKLRSPFGTDPSLKENDRPETAVAKLFASVKRNGGYGAVPHCLQDVPSDVQIRSTAAEVQNLLVSGRTKEALQCAQEGQLWGPALILAAQLGDQFYVDTVRQMAHRQLVAGSPLRTLCLLIAGQPADVFSADNNNSSGLPGALNVTQHHAQNSSNGMLDDWEENLAIIAANRTKGDELVVLHLGDCLWKERGEITAAHICYLLAEANFESFSDGARLCLLGADHWKFPRTYASPEAIQRTEFYEYSMVLGNSQSILLPFQPYKLIYAYMLAEVGKVSDSLKYCQALLKSLKTGRAPEVDAWKQLVSSLEERIKTHQQGGFSTNLAPGKLVGKLLPFIDRSIHRMIGPPPPPAAAANGHENDNHPVGARVANSQSTMAMSSLMPSASMETVSAWGGGNRSMHNRSVSEPDFGRTPRQVDPSKEASSPDGQGKGDPGAPSRIGRIGSTLFQKTIGWVSRSRSDRQAKLGDKNKFYYDEQLKRWVEEGAELPAEQAVPPPPPTTAAFQNGMSDYNIKNAFKGESPPANGGAEVRSPTHSERSSGIPPIPPSSNQFSSRGRMGVRSRYVDTFNKDKGASANFFQSPSISAAKPASAANAKFFIPTPTSSTEQRVDATGESIQESASTNEDPATFMSNNSFSPPPNSFSPPPNSFSPPPNAFSSQPISYSSPPNSFSSLPHLSSPSMQRFPSMNNITPTGRQNLGSSDNSNGPLSSRSRRTASWSGSFNPEVLNPPKTKETKPLGERLGMHPPSFMPDQSSMYTPVNGGSFGEELTEVEL